MENQGIIYIITNLINGKKYIGSDSNNNKYYYGSGVNIKMAIKKYGKNNFKKEILCFSPLKYLREMEEYYCEYYNVELSPLFYNCTNKGLGSIKGVPHSRGNKILQYTLSGLFLKEWDSYTDVLDILKIKTLGAALTGKQKTAGGFIWKYKLKKSYPLQINPFKDSRLLNKSVLQIDDKGNIIKEYISMWEAGKDFGNSSNIRKSIIYGCKAYNFTWRYK